MKNTLLMLLAAICLLLVSWSCNDDLDIPLPKFEVGGPTDVVSKDTADYYAMVYIDSPGIDKFFSGNEDAMKKQLNQVFKDVTMYWNESNKGKVKFSKYCRFNMRQMVVYDGDAKKCRSDVEKMSWDGEKYNVIVIVDQVKDKPGDSNGGAEGAGADDRPVVTLYPSGSENERDLRKGGDYKDMYVVLTHELGHYRGVTDMYQYSIDGKDNPVNGISYSTETCIMNDHYCGLWSDYAVECINANIDKKYMKQPLEFFLGLFPQKLVINVTVDGKPQQGVTVKLYGSRAGATGRARDIYKSAAYTGITNSEGKVIWNEIRKLYKPDNKPIDDLPYGRWFGFLVEVSQGIRKSYEWLPEYKVQMPSFEGEDTYTVNLAL